MISSLLHTAVTMSFRSLTIIVVGGGLGGLSAGLALQTDGHNVTILDSVTEFGEVSILQASQPILIVYDD